MKLTGSKDIKKYVGAYLNSIATSLNNKVVVDVPAGTGYSTEILLKTGADVRPFDLFPEFFKVAGVRCQSADLNKTMPLEDASADVVLFQEGIEHLQDQLHVLHEMNRVLKPGGVLLLTTPNYSNLRAKLSYFLNESEIYKLMPPNQVESIWFGESNTDDKARGGDQGSSMGSRYYFGHMFLIGIHRLKLLASLAGFRIKRIHHTRVNITSLVLLLLLYPLILFSSWRAYRRALRKNRFVGEDERKAIFKESFQLMINPKILIDSHLFVEFEKVNELDNISESLKIYHKHSDTDFQT